MSISRPNIEKVTPDAHAPAMRLSPLQLHMAEQIGKDIVGGDLIPGEHLSEEWLAKRFEVSRTPVRAALRLLAQFGMIEQRANAGYFVGGGFKDGALPDFAGAGSTSDELYQQLIDHRSRKMLPDAITDKELLARYPVPRSLMAKTLVRMSVDGLIEKRQGQGWRFLPSLETPEAIAESYRFRLLIECAGLLESTFRIDRVRLQRAIEAHERVLHLPPQQLSPGEFFAMNADFHEMLASFSGNRFILQAMQQQNQLRRFEEHDAFYRMVKSKESCQEHLQILHAVTKGDLEWASALLRRHLSGALSATMATLKI